MANLTLITQEKKREIARVLDNAKFLPYITNEESAFDAHSRISSLYEAVKMILEAL